MRLLLAAGADPAVGEVWTVAEKADRKDIAALLRAARPGQVAHAAAPQGVAAAALAPPTFITGTAQRDAYALIVGIDRYRDIPLPATGAEIDAERFAALAGTTLGVPDDHIKFATPEHATRADIEKHLLWLKSNVPVGGRIYFYFSGHGAPDPSTGTSYLLPYDGDPKSLEGTALSLPKVLKSLSETHAKDVLVMLDSCFSGAGGRSVLPEGVRPLVHVRPTSATTHVAVFAAATGAETRGRRRTGQAGCSRRMWPRGLARRRRTMTATASSRCRS